MDDRLPPLPEHVVTDRLLLRRWTIDDLESWSELIATNVEHLRPWMPWIVFEPVSLDTRRALIISWNEVWQRGGEVHMGVFLAGELIGGAGLHRRDGPGVLEIGYWIDADHLRRGYATELTRALADAAFAVDGIDRVNVATDAANVASAGVPAGLGFDGRHLERREPQAPSETGEMIVWTMTAHDWVSRIATPEST